MSESMRCEIESYRQGDVLLLRNRSAKRRTTSPGSVKRPILLSSVVDIGDEARSIIRRLAAVDRVAPKIDRASVEQAILQHLKALDVPTRPIRWIDDAEKAYADVFQKALSAAESAAESAAWSAAESAAWSAARSAAWSAAEQLALDRICGIWLPLADAYAAGLWLFWICDDEVIAVPRPAIHVEGERLHRADGPAVEWPNGQRYYFWRGLQVPRDVICNPGAITVAGIEAERNAEMRRVLLERYGVDRYMRDSGACEIHRDRFGILLRKDLDVDEPLVMVQVDNKTPEPDGSIKIYMLRVHPELRPMLDGGRFGEPQKMTARNAVASTFGLRGEQYAPTMET